MIIPDEHVEIVEISLEVLRQLTADMPLHLKIRELRIHQIVAAMMAIQEAKHCGAPNKQWVPRTEAITFGGAYHTEADLRGDIEDGVAICELRKI